MQDKTGGAIINRQGGTIVLYRGRYYNPKKRPVIPLMLWRPHEPVYPRLIKTVIDGLSIEETKDMRKRGLAVPALTTLGIVPFQNQIGPNMSSVYMDFNSVSHFCSKEWLLC